MKSMNDFSRKEYLEILTDNIVFVNPVRTLEKARKTVRSLPNFRLGLAVKLARPAEQKVLRKITGSDWLVARKSESDH